MREYFFIAAIALTACQVETGPEPISTAAPPANAPAAVQASDIEGWETAGKSYPLLGATLPGFSAERLGGGEATEDELRNRWTILGFWKGPNGGSKEEMAYIAALNSAANQDPNLDFRSIYLPGDASFDINAWGAGANAWPTLLGDETLADTLGIEAAPVYLLIGPDLTIEAYRGALSQTPQDGIKPVIRGVAEIKKQIAAP